MELKIFVSFIILVFSIRGANSAEMKEVNDFGDNPGNLRMFLYVPDNLESQRKVSLLVALHGCSQDAEALASQSGWNTLADKHGFIVIYPQQRFTNNASKCFNWFIKKDIQGGNGELGSIDEMINSVISEYTIDESKIYTYGLSAGAAMANCLLANYPDRFEAGAILAGGPFMSATNVFQGMKVMMNPADKTPEEWGEELNHSRFDKGIPRIIVLHGEKDKVVDPLNAREIIDQWSYAYEMDVIVDTQKVAFAEVDQIDRLVYSSKLEEEAIVYYRIQEIGHKLAIDPGEGEKQGGQKGVYTVDIDFHSTYYIAKDFGLF